MTLEEQWEALAVGSRPSRYPVPWEDPDLLGPVGFFHTLRDIMVSPGEFFASLGTQGDWTEPLIFALIASTLGLLFSYFWHLLILAAGLASDTAGLVFPLTLGPAALIGLMFTTPLLVLIDLAVGTLCWWGSVALVGASREFTRAWRIFCYAHGILVLAFIPIVGMPVGGIWLLVLLYIAAKRALGLSAWGSLATLAIFLIFQVVLGIILLLGLIAGLAGLGFLALLG